MHNGEAARDGVAEIRLIRFPPVDDRNGRLDEPIDTMLASIDRVGIINPLLVRPLGDGYLELIAGRTRLLALLKRGDQYAPVRIIHGELSEADIAERQREENRVRNPLLPSENAKSMERLRQLRGWTQTELAAAEGISPAQVTRALSVLRLPEDLQAKTNAGVLSLDACYKLSRLGSVEEMRAYAALIERDGLSRDRLEGLLRRKLEPETNGETKKTKRVAWKLDGVSLSLSSQESITVDAALAALKVSYRAVLKAAERGEIREAAEIARIFAGK